MRGYLQTTKVEIRGEGMPSTALAKEGLSSAGGQGFAVHGQSSLAAAATPGLRVAARVPRAEPGE